MKKYINWKIYSQWNEFSVHIQKSALTSQILRLVAVCVYPCLHCLPFVHIKKWHNDHLFLRVDNLGTWVSLNSFTHRSYTVTAQHYTVHYCLHHAMRLNLTQCDQPSFQTHCAMPLPLHPSVSDMLQISISDIKASMASIVSENDKPK